jgi:hypothetical protein
MSKKTNSKNKSDFKTDVITKLEELYENGLYIDDKKYSINKIISIYIKNMKEKFKLLGPTYLINMVKDVENIINNLSINSNYDNIEFVNSILQYCIKNIDYTHKKINNLPNLPDYTIDEIRDMTKSL